MPIDSALRYGRYNTYRLEGNEELIPEIYNVEHYNSITTQIVSIRAAGVTTGTLITRFIGADGQRIGLDRLNTIQVDIRFARRVFTLSVPDGAIKVQQIIKAGTYSWNMTCAMTEPGDIASAFSVDFALQTMMLTPEGVYAGLIQANQVVISDQSGNLTNLDAYGLRMIEQGKEYGGVTITAADGFKHVAMVNDKKLEAKMSATDGLQLFYNGEFVGGMVVIDGKGANIANMMRNKIDSKVYAEIGTININIDNIDKEIEGFALYNKDYSTSKPVAMLIPNENGSDLRIAMLKEGWNVGGASMLQAYPHLKVSDSGFSFFGKGLWYVLSRSVLRFWFDPDGSIMRSLLTIENGSITMQARDNYFAINNSLVNLKNAQGQVLSSNVSETYISHGVRKLGIDSTGFFKQVGTTEKVYF